MLSLGHKNLDVWQQIKRFVVQIYKLTETFPGLEKYSLISQIRRASVSIPSNIAEGASRSSTKDRRRFYEIARSSLVELDTQIGIAKELSYCTDDPSDRKRDESIIWKIIYANFKYRIAEILPSAFCPLPIS